MASNYIRMQEDRRAPIACMEQMDIEDPPQIRGNRKTLPDLKKEIQYEVREYGTNELKIRIAWIVVMVLLGFAIRAVHWFNFYNLSHSERERGLVVGPIPHYLLYLLLAFTVLGTLFWVPETINTFTAIVNTGETKVPISIEQTFVLTLESIPLFAINFFIIRCRSYYITVWQNLAGSVFAIYIFGRFVWYAHMEGKRAYKDKEYAINKGFFMLVSVLYTIALSFPIMCWREPGLHSDNRAHLDEISIFFLKADFLKHTYIQNGKINYLVLSEGYTLESPYIVENIISIYELEGSTFQTDYECKNSTFKPRECLEIGGQIRFYFVYLKNSPVGPFGEIRYNFAFIDSHNNKCVPFDGDLKSGWSMFYFKTVSYFPNENSFTIQNPWTLTCSTPKPYIDKTISVCTL